MDNIIFLILRRMRAPLLVLIATYTIAVIGLVLIPGLDSDGNVYRMSVFHALYFVAFMSTTIGFGEVPFEFTDAQRLWVLLCIFATVVVWIYSIGTLIALLQDKTFQRAITERRFKGTVRRMPDPFYLVCGYGQTGSALVRALTDRHQHTVTVDFDEERINLLQIENHREYVPALCADARRPEHLIEAGLNHEHCAGVVALTNVNETNLTIAIAAKLMHPKIKVICRADSHDIEANMASFGTDHIYDPFDAFALYLATALQAPGVTLLHEWLTGFRHEALKDPIYPPTKGLWILCGFGRFGKAVYDYLSKAEDIELIVVEETPERTGTPPEGVVEGRGTEADTLHEARIMDAVGLVAGTDNDANNLSIIMTARDINDDLFVVVRENHTDNQDLFDAVGADIIMHPSTIIADRIRILLGTPLLSEFERQVRFQGDAWACVLISRIAALVNEHVPEVWEITIDETEAYALSQFEEKGGCILLQTLLQDPRDRDNELPAIALMLMRNDQRELLPKSEKRLHYGDKLLFCGREEARGRMEWTQQNRHALSYILTGSSEPEGTVWRWLTRLLHAKATRSRD